MESDARPWGRYDVLLDDGRCKVKRLVVNPGARLSYQRHAHRSEHWFVVEGHGEVTLDGAVVPVRPGVAVDIPVGAAHRMRNVGDEPLVFVEVQTGSSFAEDDIERLEDDFGRGATR